MTGTVAIIDYGSSNLRSAAKAFERSVRALRAETDVLVTSDPDALAFLEGKPDPWGMHVNTNYEKFAFPLSSFVVQDLGWTDPNGLNEPYYKTMQEAWAPVTGVDNVAADLAEWQSSDYQFAATCPNTTSVTFPPCPDGIAPNNPRSPVEDFPHRALFAVMDSGTASAFRFPTAELVNAAGNAEAPTTSSMAAAVAAMKTNPDGVTQYQDFGATAPNAYPLTEVQYAMVPTCGLSSAKASAIADFLTDAADSQTYGVSLGQLPPWGGYLALTAAQQKGVQAALRQALGKDPEITTRVDPEILGGLKVKVGSRLFDASVRSKLDSLRFALKRA